MTIFHHRCVPRGVPRCVYKDQSNKEDALKIGLKIEDVQIEVEIEIKKELVDIQGPAQVEWRYVSLRMG